RRYHRPEGHEGHGEEAVARTLDEGVPARVHDRGGQHEKRYGKLERHREGCSAGREAVTKASRALWRVGRARSNQMAPEIHVKCLSLSRKRERDLSRSAAARR